MLIASGLAAVSVSGAAQGATTLPGFSEMVVYSGLSKPTVVRFSPDGRVFVAEKSGVIKVFDSLADPSPSVFADLNVNVHNFWDRGLLGMALDPDFPTNPYVYVLYTYDHEPGSTSPAPRWGTPGVYSDPCPSPPGATADGCVVSGRLSRLTASGDMMTGPEQVLVEDWCQQYPSHSVGALEFGRSGALYASAGDGANFNAVDWGQYGAPVNPCGDPPGVPGSVLSPPSAEGGALRSQDLRTAADPVTLDGTVIRVDPDTGAGLPTNPLASSDDPNARRIVAYGLRNPFRVTERPGTDELWIGDVGWSTWEEISRVPVPSAGPTNAGWPCYEGAPRQGGYDGANLDLCESLYGSPGAVAAPYYAYNRTSQVVPGEACPMGGSSITGLQFGLPSEQSPYPAEYGEALFFADYSRDCIWAMLKGADGLPDPGQVRTLVAGAANPVNLQIGPGGELFYVDFDGGTVRRISYTSTNQPPVAVATATPTSGLAPLTVSIDGSGSSDPDPGDTLDYAWDLDGDQDFDDSTAVQPTHTYSATGNYTVTLRVTDPDGASASASTTISVGNSAPTAVVDTPDSRERWKVGDVISFAGHATDAQDGSLPPSALSWDLLVQHCPSNCHAHVVQSFVGASGGSFVAPDHEAPAYLELRLTATDSGGLTSTVTTRLDPRMVALTFQSAPGGLTLTVNGTAARTPFTRNVIVGSRNTVSADSPQGSGKRVYRFVYWSDRGRQTHTITAPTAPATYAARFR